MSNQEAIALLRNLEDSLDAYCELNDEGKTAFRMAIAALELFGISEQLPSVQSKERTEERAETHACDSIDREAAVDAIYHHLPSVSRTRARTMLHEVPSAQPEIIRCKDCEYWREDHTCREHSLVSPMAANEFCSRAERREE